MQFFLDTSNENSATYEFTPSGLLRVKGAIARVGEMTYQTQDGNIYYQYVPPDTLFDQEHLNSIAGLPATLFHPDEDVTPANYKKYAIGSVGDRVIANVEKELIEVVFTIGDSDAIKAVTEDGCKQLSMGYWATLEPHPTKPDTFIQTKRVGNHVALVDKARGGDQLILQIDRLQQEPPKQNTLQQSKGDLKQWRTLSVMA